MFSEEAASSLGKLNDSHIVVANQGTLPAMLQIQMRTRCRVIIIDSTAPEEVQPLPRIPNIRLIPATATAWAEGLLDHGFTERDVAILCERYGSDYQMLRLKAFKSQR